MMTIRRRDRQREVQEKDPTFVWEIMSDVDEIGVTERDVPHGSDEI